MAPASGGAAGGVPRECPICDGGERRFLYRQRFAAPDGAALLAGYDVVACARCGLTYADGVPSQAALDAHYRERSKYENAHRQGRESPEDRARFQRVADRLVAAWPHRDRKVLEIGCATGGFLSELRARGFAAVEGLDPSPGCAAAAEALYGVRVRTASVVELAAQGERFDLVVLLAVLEHVRDLRPLVAGVASVLSERGALYVQVPDAARFHQFPGGAFQQFSTEHVNYFSRASLRALMVACGLEERAWAQGAEPEGPGAFTPVVEGLYAPVAAPAPAPRDEASAAALAAYVRRSERDEAQVRATIAEVARRGEPVLVWGAGTHTQHLLAAGELDALRIAAFVDANPHLQGKRLAGAAILAPAEVRGRGEPILVSSRGFQAEIVRYIRDELGLPNAIHTLYPPAPVS